MHTADRIDILIVIVFLVFAMIGAKRGLFMSLTRLIIVVAALIGASMAATWLQPPAVELLSPLVQQTIAQRVAELGAQTPDTPTQAAAASLLPEELDGLLQSWQLPGALDGLGQQVQQQAQQTGAALTEAVTQALLNSLVYTVLFLLFFVLLLLLLRALAEAMNLVFRLPGLNGLNTLGGFLFGLAEAGLWIFLTLWVLEWFRPELLQQYQTQSRLVQFFADFSPTQLLQSLKMPLK